MPGCHCLSVSLHLTCVVQVEKATDKIDEVKNSLTSKVADLKAKASSTD